MNEHPAAAQFIERLGLVLEADGLPRIAGRLLAYLLIHGGPCSFDELAGALQVSRASISTNTRLLESIGIVERVAQPGDRRDYYQVGGDPYSRLLERAIERMKRVEDITAECRQALPDEMAEARGRLAEMESFHGFVRGSIESDLAHWRQRRAATQASTATARR